MFKLSVVYSVIVGHLLCIVIIIGNTLHTVPMHFFCYFDAVQERLYVGSHLHCLISDAGLANAGGDNRVVSVVIEPQRVHQSMVSV